MMGKRIIVAAAVLVNAAIGFSAHAAARVEKNDVATLIKWLQMTGKDREDYNAENAMLIGLKKGEAKSKARGAPGKEGEPFRFVHLFSKKDKPLFIVIKKGTEDSSGNDAVTYKVMPNGKIATAFRMTSKLDSKGAVIESSIKQTDIKLDKQAQQAVSEEVAFWLPRAQKDLPPPPAPAAKN